MVWSDLFRDTMRTLFAHKLRTLLTMFGIAWGIVSITLMVAAGEGLRVGQAKVAESFSRDVMIVFAGRTSLQVGGLRAGRRVQWTATDHLEVAKQAPACGYVMPELGQGAPVRSAHNSASLTITGSMPDFAYIRSIPVAEGRYPNWDDERQVRRVAFLGSDAKKQLFGNRPAMGETLRIGDFPYTVVGVMRHKEQDSSYDGRDIGKVFLPFSAILQDFPNKPPSCPTRWTACSWPRGRSPTTRPARASCAGPRPDPRLRPAGRGGGPHLGHGRGGEGLQDDDGRHEVLPGRGGDRDALHRRHRRDERHAGGGAGADARDRRAQGAGRHAAVHRPAVRRGDAARGLRQRGSGPAVAYGLCALVNLLPMPPFFAGLLPTWSSGADGVRSARHGGALAAVYPARRAASIDPIEALRWEAGG